MNLFQSIINYKCPKCRKGDLFVKPLDLGKPLNMPKQCSHCNQRFNPEPGFYWGAMYVAYGLVAFTLGPIAFFCSLSLDWEVGQVLALIIFLAIVFYVWYMRIARSIWIHINISFSSTHHHHKRR